MTVRVSLYEVYNDCIYDLLNMPDVMPINKKLPTLKVRAARQGNSRTRVPQKLTGLVSPDGPARERPRALRGGAKGPQLTLTSVVLVLGFRAAEGGRRRARVRGRAGGGGGRGAYRGAGRLPPRYTDSE
jgi:hypothetical protein